MHTLWPISGETSPRPVDPLELERLYDYPDDLARPWVQANFVSSADGAVTVDGRSDGLSHPADKKIFALARDLADVILVGARTAAVERYRGLRPTKVRTERRNRHGLAGLPRIAVVSGRCTIGPDDPLIADTIAAPIVITTESAPADRVAALTDAGAHVIVSGRRAVDLPEVLGELGKLGLNRINCEGGPHLFAALIAADLVDELCLTISPLLVGAGPGRIVEGVPAEAVRAMTVSSVLFEDGYTMLRYRRRALEQGN